ISYHSLADRKVKRRFRELTTAPKDAITGAPIAPASYELLTKKAVQATLEELEANPRARSARLRVIKKLP
ncbi:MAG: 16S rRNA (cytosine(1402)-N(4))-methyltransferase, partial [Chloroflexi bacterium]|nr:16S rRNA (cytosine(1402)-N(4))-methyltransferase [Chloroflexota bacterium]